MRRHLLVGSFGPRDRAVVPSAPDEIVTQLPLVIGQKSLNFGIHRLLQDLRELQVFPSEIGADFIILATHVYAADTRISRSTESQDAWTREFRLVVPVSAPALWSAASPLLSRMLNFLTGDKWIIGFRARPAQFMTTVPRKRNATLQPPFDQINLFSGGLDSLIGAIDSLEVGRQPLFVSHAGEGATSDSQRNCFDSLKKHYKRSPSSVSVYGLTFPSLLSVVSGVKIRHAADPSSSSHSGFWPVVALIDRSFWMCQKTGS